MAEASTPPARNMSRIIAVAAAALGLGLLLALSLNVPGGPTEDTTGVIEASYFVPSNVGAPVHQVTVRLKDGALVQAQVEATVGPQPGQTARVRIYRHVITGTRSYKLVGTEPKR